MDARARRSRTKLAAAVLGLAERDGIDRVSMVAIAQTAGVNRSTVYEHATSPLDLLRSVLRDELDAIRAQHLEPDRGHDLRLGIRDTTIDVLHHVDTHARIYARELGGTGSTALHGMLSSHFHQSVLSIIQSGGVRVPDAGGLPPHVRDEAAARFIADGTVGAINAWLSAPPPRDADDFFALFRELMPSWWPLA